MATVKNGFLGNAAGKLGNVVFKKYKRLQVASKYQPYVQDRKSTEQLTQRRKMSVITEFLKDFDKGFFDVFYYYTKSVKSGFSQAIRDNINIVDDLGNIDITKLSFGNPSIKAPILYEQTYDPFIDQIKVVGNFTKPISVLIFREIEQYLGPVNTSDTYNVPFGQIYVCRIYGAHAEQESVSYWCNYGGLGALYEIGDIPF